MNGVEGNKGSQLGVEMQVPDDLQKRAEAAEGFEVGQRYGHLGLVVVVSVHVGSFGVEPLGELLVRMRLRWLANGGTVVAAVVGVVGVAGAVPSVGHQWQRQMPLAFMVFIYTKKKSGGITFPGSR